MVNEKRRKILRLYLSLLFKLFLNTHDPDGRVFIVFLLKEVVV